jgi:alanine dehydrogenase
VLVLGGGVAGVAAAEIAQALGNAVHVLELDPQRRREIAATQPGIRVHESTDEEIQALLPQADVVLNTVPFGAHSETHLVTRDMLGLMKRTAMIVDVACDTEGAIETCRTATHDDPVYEVDGIRHYAVGNIPGAVPATSTPALTAATFPYVRAIATKGLARAVADDPALARSVVFAGGKVTFADFAALLGVACCDPVKVVAEPKP